MNNPINVPNDTMNEIKKELLPKKCKLIGIYGLRNKLNNKWYVGQSWNIHTRWYIAYEKMHCKKQSKLYNALKKYGYDGFEKRFIELCDANIPQEMLDKKETSWIKHYNSVEHGYNIASGGLGGKPSQETIDKRRATRKGTKFTEQALQNMRDGWKKRKLIPVSNETRAKMSSASKGRPAPKRTEEWRTKQRNSHLGKAPGNKGIPHSPETRLKISIALTGRKVTPFTQEHKDNLRKSNIGKKHTKKSLQQCESFAQVPVIQSTHII